MLEDFLQWCTEGKKLLATFFKFVTNFVNSKDGQKLRFKLVNKLFKNPSLKI